MMRAIRHIIAQKRVCEAAVTITRERTNLLTADDLLRLYSEGARGELIRGVFCETMSAGEEHGEIVLNLGIILGGFIKPRRLGRLVGSNTGVRLERSPDTVREPDIAFISASKRPLGTRNTGYVEVIPDLVVEVVSPNDRLAEVNDKALMWLNYGVPVVWVVYPDTRTLEVHQPDGYVVTLDEGDALGGGTVLPGFTCPIRDIFDL